MNLACILIPVIFTQKRVSKILEWASNPIYRKLHFKAAASWGEKPRNPEWSPQAEGGSPGTSRPAALYWQTLLGVLGSSRACQAPLSHWEIIALESAEYSRMARNALNVGWSLHWSWEVLGNCDCLSVWPPIHVSGIEIVGVWTEGGVRTRVFVVVAASEIRSSMSKTFPEDVQSYNSRPGTLWRTSVSLWDGHFGALEHY